MISVEEARAAVLEPVATLPRERVPLLDSLGRVLAEDVISDIDIAPFDNSAMDGYAVRAQDVAGATPEEPVVLRVVDHIAAGSLPQVPVGPREAARIMTGAPMAEGADAVVMVEVTRPGEMDGGTGGTVLIEKPVRATENVRFRGEDVKTGGVVLKTGEKVDEAAIGLMAAMGYPEVFVYRRPRVAIVSTGDELVTIDEKPGPGKIRNSNSWSLAAQVLAAGGVPVQLGIARDTEEETREVLERAGEFDAMLSTGGVSMGDFDVVKGVLSSLGQMSFWRVAMRPGAPLTFGLIGGTPFFGLPGNPTSSMVSFELFVRPALRVMQGFSAIERPRVTAKLAADVKKKPDRRYFLRARLQRSGEGLVASLTRSQSSAVLTAMHEADCLIVLPEEGSFFEAGSEVTCIRLDVPEEA